VHQDVRISHRGARYAIGQGPGFYGIWPAAAPASPPFERWPQTPEGWRGAWLRFTAIEVPGTIVTAGQATAPDPVVTAGQPASRSTVTRGRAIAAAVLLGAGICCGIAGLFPGYLGPASLAQEPAELAPHVIYLVGWAASALLILLGGVRARVGALLGTGLSAVTFGLFFADFATALGAAQLTRAGLVLSLIGWLACAAGSVLALPLRPVAVGRPRGQEATLILTLAVLAALGTAIAFVPSWDSYTLRTAAGVSQYVTAGNAFANPALVIAGDVAVMVALVAAVLVAGLWRPIRLGAALAAGATIPMAAQAISAFVQLGEPVSPLQFGITPSQAAQAGLTISSGLTAAFWVYCTFLVALLLACLWMLLITPSGPAGPAARSPWAVSSHVPGTTNLPGTVSGADEPGPGQPAAR
jgi:hypothetical protein